MEQEPGISISPDQLTPEALRGVIEEFVTRDGTELTDSKTKIEEVRELLRSGEAEIWFDRATGSCNIVRIE